VCRGCVGGVGGVKGFLGCIMCQKRLRSSWKVDECKPLAGGARGSREVVYEGRRGRAGGVLRTALTPT